MRAPFRACLSGCSKQCCFEEGKPENEPFATDGPSVSLGWSGLASGESEVLDFEKKENDMPVGMRLDPTTRSERELTTVWRMAFQYMGSPLHMLVTCWRGAASGGVTFTVSCQTQLNTVGIISEFP
jgi:hypothetical protein